MTYEKYDRSEKLEKPDKPERPEKPAIPVPKLKPSAPRERTGEHAEALVDEPEVIPPPVISGLLPPTAAVGDPSFGLRVVGSGFDLNSVIVFAGNDEPTTYFSESELTTGMNMPLWTGPDSLSVQVRNLDGQESNTVPFVLTPAPAVPVDPASASKPTPAVDLI